jgi:hypothetical protein
MYPEEMIPEPWKDREIKVKWEDTYGMYYLYEQPNGFYIVHVPGHPGDDDKWWRKASVRGPMTIIKLVKSLTK